VANIGLGEFAILAVIGLVPLGIAATVIVALVRHRRHDD
jgi:hypothetical protein